MRNALEAGMSLQEITEEFDVTLDQIKAVLHFATQSLEKDHRARPLPHPRSGELERQALKELGL